MKIKINDTAVLLFLYKNLEREIKGKKHSQIFSKAQWIKDVLGFYNYYTLHSVLSVGQNCFQREESSGESKTIIYAKYTERTQDMLQLSEKIFSGGIYVTKCS